MNGKREYVAHISENGERQSVREHCIATAEICSEIAADSLKEICRSIGLLHDIGKYQPSFQKKICEGKQLRVDHSVCGAQAAKAMYGTSTAGLLMELCISGHHAGLPDCGTKYDSAGTPSLFGRLKEKTEDYSCYAKEIHVVAADDEIDAVIDDGNAALQCRIEKFAFFVRYCYSCLVDADSADTRAFCTGNYPADYFAQRLHCDFPSAMNLLKKRKTQFSQETPIQRARTSLQSEAAARIHSDADVYIMHMPTGSGKTLCSLECALTMLEESKGKLNRIIYVIPYNSIIDQTAEIFAEFFGEDNILRHQSTFAFEEKDTFDTESAKTMRLSLENWNADVIITTAVQFFESAYSAKRGKLQKLHNTANSVIVFDEVHMMPLDYLQPCLQLVSHITRTLGSKAIFLSATMPDFSSLFCRYTDGNSRIVSLIDEGKKLFPLFSTASYTNIGVCSDEKLISKASENASSLIVVNSRKAAREIYSMCSGRKFHLSTYMTSIDRMKTITEIKSALTRMYSEYDDLSSVPEEERIVVVSTSLIEAGVDVDFAAVFREIAPLDSILQSGGRCNREGKRQKEQVSVFTRGKNSMAANDMRVSITESIFSKYSDVSSPEAVEEYYSRFMNFSDDVICKNSLCTWDPNCRNYKSIKFREYGEKFRIIPSSEVSVAAAVDDESRLLMEKAAGGGKISQRNVQKYCFAVYPKEFALLQSQGVVDDFGTGIYWITNMEYYDEKIGVLFEGKDIFV